MSAAWFRRACDRAFNLGLTMAELSRRVHGRLDRRDMVEAAVELEEIIQRDIEKFGKEATCPH